MKLIIAAALVAGSAAFLPSGNNAAARGAELGLFKKGKAEPSPLAGEIGVQVPLGFTDPLKLLGDGTDKELFGNYRYVELKHGRVAMLAVTGYLVTKAGVRLPGYEDIPSGLAALKEMPANAWLWTGFTVAILEIMMRDETGESQFPGDFRNGFDFGTCHDDACVFVCLCYCSLTRWMLVRRHDCMLGVFALPLVYPFSLFITNNRLG